MFHSTSSLSTIVLMFLPCLLAAQPACSWQPDWNADGEVGTVDLLELLGAFGPWQSSCPTEEALSTAASSEDACHGITSLHHQGDTYELVGIGDQCWFRANLRANAYNSEHAIVTGLDNSAWLSTKEGAVTIYGEEPGSRVYAGSEDEVANLADFGRLYNWFAVNDGRGLCPPGWRVPKDEDWVELNAVLLADTSLQGALAFAPKYGGGRNYGGFYGSGEASAFWWSASAAGDFASYWRLDRGDEVMIRGQGNRKMGASVRCLWED